MFSIVPCLWLIVLLNVLSLFNCGHTLFGHHNFFIAPYSFITMNCCTNGVSYYILAVLYYTNKMTHCTIIILYWATTIFNCAINVAPLKSQYVPSHGLICQYNGMFYHNNVLVNQYKYAFVPLSCLIFAITSVVTDRALLCYQSVIMFLQVSIVPPKFSTVPSQYPVEFLHVQQCSSVTEP